MQAVPFRHHDISEQGKPTALRNRRGNFYYNLGDWGDMGYIGGPPGSYKSTVANHLAAAGLSGEEILQFDFKLGDRCIIIAEGEQPQTQFDKRVLSILALAGKPFDNRLIPYRFSSILDAEERRNELWRLIGQYRNDLGLIVVDGIAHFMADSNDRFETKRVCSQFNKIAIDYQCMPLFINHTTLKVDKTVKLYGTNGTEIDKIATWGYLTAQQGRYIGVTKGKFRIDKSTPNMWMTHQGDQLIPEPYFPY